MKLFISAIALAIGVPAVAHAAPAAQAGSQHQGMAGMDHSQHGQNDPHKGHDMKEGCCADKDRNGKMDCCEKKEQATTAAPKTPPRN